MSTRRPPFARLSRRDALKSMALAGAVPAVLPAGQAPAAHPLVAFRLGSNLWLEDAPFDAMLRFFARQPGAVDELAFFTSATHPPLPLAEMERRAARLGKLLPRVREQGMRAGINVLSTMGHHEENLPFSLSAPWQRVRDAQGRESLGSFCPAQPELIGYARQIYTAMAQAGPDFIWVDDDIRLQGHKPANLTCFCDACVAAFSKHTGTPFTREKLVAAFDAGLLENRLRLRREWLEHNRGVVNTLLRNIEEAVHEVKPGLPLGFMTGDRFYEGYAFERWAGTLAGKAGAPVRWRPGGGFYADESLLGLVDKAHASGRQCSALPAGVTAIQSEVENFPYQRLRKSAHTTAVEAAAHMAAGTTGTAFNVLTMQNDPLDEYGPLFRKLCQYRPFYAKLEAALGRSLALGVWPAWNADSFTTVNADSGWLSGGRMPLNEPCVLGEVGIPICYDQRGAAVTALTGASVLAFPRDELRRMFGGAVLLDVAAWKTLERLQLDSWTGVRGVEPVDHDATEILSAHAVNGRFAGWGRDCRQSFNWERAWNLRPQSAATETLARMVDYGGRDLGVSMTAATNQFGGRVVTMGYYPWSQLHSLAKTSQLKAVCGWLSRGTLPAVAESFAKVVIWCRRGVGGRMALVVLNASLDPVEHLSLRVMTDGAAFTHSQPEAEDRRIAAARIPDAPGAMRVVVPHLEPWSIHLLTAQTA